LSPNHGKPTQKFFEDYIILYNITLPPTKNAACKLQKTQMKLYKYNMPSSVQLFYGSRQGVGYNIVMPFNVMYPQIILLESQTPVEKPLILVLHFLNKNKRIVVRVNINRGGSGT